MKAKKYYIGGGIDGLTLKKSTHPLVPEKPKIVIKEVEPPKVVSKFVRQGTEKWIDASITYRKRINNNKCVVVIPVYKKPDTLKGDEKLSLKRVVAILGGKYNLVLVHPTTLNIDEYRRMFTYQFAELGLNPDYFRRQRSYSNLCEQPEFYACFNEYEYMFIYQTDAWIFEDRLEYFMNMGYDYIGGVHFLRRDREGQNGNGGFCLRKVAKFQEVSGSVDWSKVPYGQLEDCAFTQTFKSHFNLAPLNVCYEFSWQEHPEIAITKNNNKLPMGCHAYKKFGSIFWKKYIQYE